MLEIRSLEQPKPSEFWNDVVFKGKTYSMLGGMVVDRVVPIAGVRHVAIDPTLVECMHPMTDEAREESMGEVLSTKFFVIDTSCHGLCHSNQLTWHGDDINDARMLAEHDLIMTWGWNALSWVTITQDHIDTFVFADFRSYARDLVAKAANAGAEHVDAGSRSLH